MSKQKIIFDLSGPISKDTLEAYIKINKMNLGWFGRVFGNAENAPTSTCGMLMMLLTVTGCLLFIFDKQKALEFWKLISTLMGGLFVYLIGGKKLNN